jgi:hypothetical protein
MTKETIMMDPEALRGGTGLTTASPGDTRTPLRQLLERMFSENPSPEQIAKIDETEAEYEAVLARLPRRSVLQTEPQAARPTRPEMEAVFLAAKRAVEKLSEAELRAVVELGMDRIYWPGLLAYHEAVTASKTWIDPQVQNHRDGAWAEFHRSAEHRKVVFTHTWDFATNNCSVCGASRAQVDDNLIGACPGIMTDAATRPGSGT